MNNLIGLLRELRLMKDQPSHRFYAVWLLILLFIGRGFVLIVLILGGGFVIKPAFVMGLLSRFF